jgi:hypothetical protein
MKVWAAGGAGFLLAANAAMARLPRRTALLVPRKRIIPWVPIKPSSE